MSLQTKLCVAGKSFGKRGNFLSETSQDTRRNWRGLVHSQTGIHVPPNGCVRFAPSSPLASTMNGDMNSNNKGRAILPLVLAITFASTTLIFAGLFVHEHKALDRTAQALKMEADAAQELKQSVQAAIADQDKQYATQTAQDKFASFFGVYNCPDVQNENQIDLRSDGTAIFYMQTQGGDERIWGKSGTWEMDGSNIWIKKGSGQPQRYASEQGDLIDRRGNRWLHVR